MRRIVRGLRKSILGMGQCWRIPVSSEHWRLSVISPPRPTQPDAALLRFCLRAVSRAMDVSFAELGARSAGAARYLELFPGEHYKLLAGIVGCLQDEGGQLPIVEIGTFTGLSALAMASQLRNGKITTYDLVPWTSLQGDAALRAEDFSSGTIEQRLGDLADSRFFSENAATLSDARLIFMDGPKDGVFEYRFLRLLRAIPRTTKCLLVMDDIHVWNMLGLWSELDLPKVDMTSFGHWSGTGLCVLG